MENNLTINSISAIQKDNKNDSGKPFLCKFCKKLTPLIDFKNNNLEMIFYSCQCSYISNYGIDNVMDSDSLLIDENNDANEDYFQLMKCNKHSKEKNIILDYSKFRGYCRDHNENFCKLCINEHLNDDIVNFDDLRFEIEENIQNLIKIFKLNENIDDIDDIDNLDFSFVEIKNIRILINMIINDYKRFPNYNIIKNIKKIHQISEHFIKTENKNLDELNMEKILNIKYIHELEELFIQDDKNNQLINSINLKQINLDISRLCKINLINLKELSLCDNNISNIEPLINATFIDLKNLDLSKNKLDNDNIPYIKKFKFAELISLNLFSNDFTDFEIFKAVEKFKKLKGLSIGLNKLEIFNIDINQTKINLDSINKLHLINGVFSDKTIKFIKCLSLLNLKDIYLDGNNLNSLEFINNVEWPSLEKIYLNRNNISDIEPLKKFKNLTTIEIRKNNIYCDEEFEKIIENMERLEEIKIAGNNIEKYLYNNIFN